MARTPSPLAYLPIRYDGAGKLSGPVQPLTVDPSGWIFRLPDGAPWRWRGVTAFKLLARWAAGEDVTPFLAAYRGFNLLRVWCYTEWGAASWDVRDAGTINAFIADMNVRGWWVELTLLTDDAPSRLAWAQALVPQLTAAHHLGLILEGGNEPTTHKAIDTPALRGALEASGYPHASGDYEDSARAYGTHGVAHTARTTDWPRRAHDLMEYHNGGGPNQPSDPAHRNPWVSDEPAKLQDVAVVAKDWRAHFGTASILGAGATFHCETAKYADLPTPDEQAMARAALEGLLAFPADAPLAMASYRKIVEPGQSSEARTYVVGDCAVRCQQIGTSFPEPGWTSLDADGVLWRKG